MLCYAAPARQRSLVRNIRQLLSNFALQQLVCQHPDVRRLQQSGETINRLLNETAITKKFEDLFRAPLAAPGPKARAAPSSHDEAVPVISHRPTQCSSLSSLAVDYGFGLPLLSARG